MTIRGARGRFTASEDAAADHAAALTLPLTEEALYRDARMYRGIPHGGDANGLVDIEFPTIGHAASFAPQWEEITTVTLRDPVTSLSAPCVIQVQL